MRYLLLFIPLFIYALPSSAQFTVDLDTIAVNATRIAGDISESGKNISVFTRQDIERIPANSVDELLRSLPGLNINSRQGFGVQSDVGMRGSTYAQVLFMLDNVPLNDPLTSHFNANIPVALSEIKQIEIIRGPASASFGADAVGGVVHIKTAAYMERQAPVSGTDLITNIDADLSGGQHSLFQGDMSLNLKKDRWRFSLAARSVSSDGERLPNPGFDAGTSEEEEYDNYFGLSNVSASFVYRLSDSWNIYTRAGMDERDFSARYFYTRNPFDESVEQINSRWSISALTREQGNHRSELNFSFREVEDIFDFNSRIGVPANEHTTETVYIHGSHEINLGSSDRLGLRNSRIMMGGNILNKDIVSTDRGDHEDRSGGAYLIGYAATNFGLSATFSNRIQFFQEGDAEYLPQVNLAFNRNQITFRSSFGRAIRTGDFTERFISSQIPELLPGRNIGNPDLKPEKSVTFDIGLDWRPTESTSISPTFFLRNSTNLIDYILTNSNDITNADNLQPDENYFYAQNVSETQTSGLELLVDQHIRVQENLGLGLTGGYTYINTSGITGVLSKYIANHPKHQVSLGVRLTASRFSLNSESSFRVRSEELEDVIGAEVPANYFVSDLNVGYSIQAIPAHVYIRVMNLTDSSYQEILGAPMPGRWALAGIRFSI